MLAVPNFSEGRDTSVIAAIRAALDRERGLLDRHSDAEHNRTVYTLTGDGRSLDELLAAAAAVAVERIDMRRHRGLHPCIGALDVSPLVWLDEQGREPATERARSVGEQIAGLGVPVFLYGDLASSEQRRERAFFREGGLETLRQRMKAGELAPDLGPAIPHLSAGATLVTARPPLAAFNLELDTADAAVAQRVAAALREAGGGPKGVRAIGLPLGDGRSQVSTNVHDPISVPLRVVVERVRELAEQLGARPIEAEIVGLVPAAALQGFPADVPIRDFDPERHVIEARIGGSDPAARLS
jgi:glutamate formiminotransferase/glutamate formiminotransferase/formiminotetrahydrofolate cyclodeaminase